MQFMKSLSMAFIVTISLAGSLRAENWSHWRGPHFNGSSEETTLPAQFSKTQNVRWAAAMPGSSAATPIIWGDHVFVSSADDRNKTMRALCLDRKDGKILWNQEVGIGYSLDDKSN